MIARTRVTPPVTPRIVQLRPGQQRFRYALLVCAFLATIWISYEIGRAQAPGNADAPPAQSIETEADVLQLQQARDALQQQVKELEQRLQQEQQALAAARTRTATPQQSATAERETPAEAPAPAVAVPLITAAQQQEAADYSLKLDNLRILKTASENVFRIGFSVLHTGDSGDRVIGTIWIAVNGFVDGKPTRLSLKTLTPEARPFLKMGFDLQQDVVEKIVLPTGFRPKNILIEAKPFGDNYTGAEETFAWVADE